MKRLRLFLLLCLLAVPVTGLSVGCEGEPVEDGETEVFE